MSVDKTDVLIIGAGAVGVAVARELSKFALDVLVVDRLNDVGGDASKSNSAIVHTGFDAEPGSLESQMVVHANPMFDELCAALDIPFSRCGAILVAATPEEEEQLPSIMEKAWKNHVFDVQLLTSEEILRLEPQVTSDVRGGVLIPRESIVDPFILVVAQAENAAANDVRFATSCELSDIRYEAGRFIVSHENGSVESRFVVNAAGLRADSISGFLGIKDFEVTPRRGQFHVIDRSAPLDIEHIILPVPTKITKGKLLAPTIHGNWLTGPTAEDIEDKDGHETTTAGMDDIISGVKKLVPAVDAKYAITQYSGLRPVRTPGGYHLRTFPTFPGYLELSGIRSTGVSASLAVAKFAVRELQGMGMSSEIDSRHIGVRSGIPRFRDLEDAEKERLIREDPRYGNIVCRCETITEAEVIEAIVRNPGAKDIDGIKRRVRAGLGRCQGGFCGTKIPWILADQLGLDPLSVTKRGRGSEILLEQNRTPEYPA